VLGALAMKTEEMLAVQREHGAIVGGRAYGNLDGDGISSTFERAGRVSASGEVEVDGFNITNELE